MTATGSPPVRSAATAESTPPLIATSVRSGENGTAAPARAAAPRARCSASAARSAACSLPVDSPPSSSEIAVVPTRAASSTEAPATSATTADPAAVAAPQPEASKPASATRSPDTRSEIGHEVTASGSAGGSAERAGGDVTLPLWKLQVLGKSLGAHAPSVGAARSS